MSLNTPEIVRRRAVAERLDARERSGRDVGGDVSTALFTGVNVAVFLILAACVVGAAVLYGLGA